MVSSHYGTYVDLSWKVFCGIQLRTITQEGPMILCCDMSGDCTFKVTTTTLRGQWVTYHNIICWSCPEIFSLTWFNCNHSYIAWILIIKIIIHLMKLKSDGILFTALHVWINLIDFVASNVFLFLCYVSVNWVSHLLSEAYQLQSVLIEMINIYFSTFFIKLKQYYNNVIRHLISYLIKMIQIN